VEVPTLAADREVEGAVGATPLDHQAHGDSPPHRTSQIPLAEPREALCQLTAAAEAVVSEDDDRGDDLLRRR
jgi:hypothetical protein